MVNITNLRHERINLGKFERHVLTHLDGRHNFDKLIDVLAQLTTAGDLTLEINDRPVTEPEQVRMVVREMLQQHLPQLVQKALLVN